MEKKKKIITGIIIGGCLIAFIAAFALGPQGRKGRKEGAAYGRTIGLIRIEGTITGGTGSTSLLGGSTVGADQICAYLKQAREDDNIKAVVLRINSPGGSAPASQEIGVEVQKLRDAGKLVVASMGDTAASGGYWIAATADTIVANPATLTGSIGVIMETQNLQGLYEKLGIEQEVIKSAEHKDIGSPYRDMTEKEREILQGMVDDIFDQFIEVVAKGRNLPEEKVRELADGRIFTGRQALALGLVDKLGNFQDALDLAAEQAGLGENYSLHEYGQQSTWEKLFGPLLETNALGESLKPAQEIKLYRELFRRLFNSKQARLGGIN
jgi:protease-4